MGSHDKNSKWVTFISRDGCYNLAEVGLHAILGLNSLTIKPEIFMRRSNNIVRIHWLAPKADR